MAYDHRSLEQKWQKYWEENKTYRTENPVSDVSSRRDLFPNQE